ncbi:MmcQ/YjbR family DNA-binding protein [Furfurilactobacillus sp. WILCCON 0119]
MTDPETATPYVLHVSESQGRYVAKVRKAYTSLLTTIAEQCSHPQVFTSPQAQAVIAACADQFDSHPEFLWARTPNNAIFRKASNQKWFAALLTVPKNKVIGTDSTPVELIDVRVPSDQLTTLVDHQTVFPGYHMNKQHWVTVLLDGSMATERLLTLIAASYELAVK